jgi:acylphosphatase
MHLLRTLVIQLANLNVRAQVMGPDEEVERLRRELALLEKGKVPVKGLLET